jgi:class 3 adenylate cyclase
MIERTEYLDCLILTQQFESYWISYWLSDGQLYSGPCRETARELISRLQELAKKDPRIFNPDFSKVEGGHDLQGYLSRLKDWAYSKTPLPFEGSRRDSRTLVGIFTGHVKLFLAEELGATVRPDAEIQSEELSRRLGIVRWRAHLPESVLTCKDPHELLKKASSSATIVVVADIKRSQDLMTYATNTESFSHNMVSLINETRKLVDVYGGIFDKFTGDGFIAYFNEAVCEEHSIVCDSYIDCFINFIRSVAEFAAELFANWTKTIRKLPPKPVGLTFGADLGIVSFRDIHDHLIAVGDTIVWADRMSSIGQKDEVVVNNILYHSLKNLPHLSFEPRQGETKSGETFLAHILRFEE